MVGDATRDGRYVFRCLGSDCSDDDDCGDGRACEYTGKLGRSVFRCRVAGVRAAGEPCGALDSKDPDELCGRGLDCAGGWCLPSQCQRDDDCPRGSRCTLMGGDLDVHECSPGCTEDRDCPDGQRCDLVSAGAPPICVPTDAAPSCHETGCPAGQLCVTRFPFAWAPRTACVTPCSPGMCEPLGTGDGCVFDPARFLERHFPAELRASHSAPDARGSR